MALIIDIKVKPKSSCAKIILDKTGKLIAYVKSPAQDGKANKELIKMLALQLSLTQADITILSGLTCPNKKIKINDILTYESILHKLGLEKQSSLL